MGMMEKLKDRWGRLNSWQKGGGFLGLFYFISMILFQGLFYLFFPTTHSIGNGDMGPMSAWILVPIYWAINAPPLLALYFFSIIAPAFRDTIEFWGKGAMGFWFGDPTHANFYFSYLFFGVLIYGILGSTAWKFIEVWKKGE